MEFERWKDLELLLRRSSPMCQPAFEAGPENLEFIRTQCRILVIGAGGLGCELLKDLALSGFGQIEVIDMDVIDVSNLNRQFLFRKSDVGKSKAQVAARFVSQRCPSTTVRAHMNNIMDFDDDFYRNFHIIVAGLDSIEARRWLNALIVRMVQFDDDGNIDPSTIIPLVDGGTEGFLGQARVIIPKITACFECTLDLFPPQRNFPLCTMANTPRLPEHCIEYAHLVLWSSVKPFGTCAFDGDNSEHVEWVYTRALQRAENFGIHGVTYRLTQGVVKNIVPAVASTNAIVAAVSAHEVLKLATYIGPSMKNYMMYNGHRGVYTYTYENEKKVDCGVCGAPAPKRIRLSKDETLQMLVERLKEDPELRLSKPSLRWMSGGALYFSTPEALEKQTAVNLPKSLYELFVSNSNHASHKVSEQNMQMHLTLSDSVLPMVRSIILELTQ
uniref:NEDD8-activating enzyme E1 catalytic subunit n=1 Tax=Timspurckia oligopyrenoides TaxID=708627 RepID=A0A7S0ZEE8_9RHOD|mmetsp:Transcript_1974/g.3512  ORF Transcript_1974/g.3512 Transcript_1974/m.3512 type:complete len:443 (+) Transcript_1974:51-1379(+)